MEAAEALLSEALSLCRSQEKVSGLSASGISATLIRLAELAMERGDQEMARPLLDEALERARNVSGDLRALDCLSNLGRLELEIGDLVKAEAWFEQAQAVVDATGSTGSQQVLGLLRLALARGDLVAAQGFGEAALGHARRKGNVLAVTEVVFWLGELARAEGDLDEATSRHQWALGERARVGNLPGVARSQEALAGLLAVRHQPARAVRLLAAAESLRAARGFIRPPAERGAYEAAVHALRLGLPGEEFSDAWAEGAAFTVAQATSFALDAVEVR